MWGTGTVSRAKIPRSSAPIVSSDRGMKYDERALSSLELGKGVYLLLERHLFIFGFAASQNAL